MTKEPYKWITVQGKHIPVYRGEDGNDVFGVGQETDPEHKTKDLKDGDLIVFNAGNNLEKKESIVVEKDAKKYTTFKLKSRSTRYRMNKETGEIQVAPYWNAVKELYIEDGGKR